MGKRNYDIVVDDIIHETRILNRIILNQKLEMGEHRFIIKGICSNTEWEISVWDNAKLKKSIFGVTDKQQYDTKNLDWFINNENTIYLDEMDITRYRGNYSPDYYHQKYVHIFRENFLPLYLAMRDRCISMVGL